MNKEIKISIKNRRTGSILFEYSSVDNTLAKTVTEALKGGANLRGADLRGADPVSYTHLTLPTIA